MNIEDIILKLDEKNISQRKLSNEIGISENSISLMLNGKTKPRVKTKLKIKKFLESIEN